MIVTHLNAERHIGLIGEMVVLGSYRRQIAQKQLQQSPMNTILLGSHWRG
jgi:hypothetical protein